MKNIDELNFDEFQQYCDRKECLRATIYNENQCIRETKRKRCYDKWMLKRLNNKIFIQDSKWEKCREKVWMRDAKFYEPGNFRTKDWRKICRLYRCLNKEERDAFELSDVDNMWMAEILDPAHEFGRNVEPKLKYNENYIFLISRLFHSRLDIYCCPLTGKVISFEERESWFNRIKNHDFR